MADLPTGTVTFLLTDIEGSTPLWEREPVWLAQSDGTASIIHPSDRSEPGGAPPTDDSAPRPEESSRPCPDRP